jgi:transcriptional repressor NrdR
MKCPYCRSTSTEVFNTRTTKAGGQIWRRRRCTSCQQAFTTYETVDLSFLRVLPAGAHKPVPYSRATLYASLAAAFAAGQAPASTVDAVTDTVEAKLLDLQQTIIPAGTIAHTAFATLKAFHPPAYLRYLTDHAEHAASRELRRELGRF